MYAEHVISIAYRQTAMHMILSHDRGHSLRRFRGIVGLSFGDEGSFGDALAHKVIMADAAFTEFRIGCRPTGRDYKGCESLPEEFIGMIEPRPEYRRRPAIVLRGTKHNDGVGGIQFLFCRVLEDGYEN